MCVRFGLVEKMNFCQLEKNVEHYECTCVAKLHINYSVFPNYCSGDHKRSATIHQVLTLKIKCWFQNLISQDLKPQHKGLHIYSRSKTARGSRASGKAGGPPGYKDWKLCDPLSYPLGNERTLV